MMTVYTKTQLTSDHGDRVGVKPSLVVLHHTAFVGSIQSLINLMMPGGRTVSAHAAIRDNDIVNVVPESRRSFSLGAAVFERRVLSAECINSTGGPSWSLSDATHESIARWVADVCKRHGIRPHREGPPSSWTVIGHREVLTIHRQGYATACPGGMRVDWIVARAQQLLTPALALQTVHVLESEIIMKLVQRTGSATPEWSLFHPSLKGASELERGYILVMDPVMALDLARTWHQGGGSEAQEPRDVYVAMQASARLTHDAYRRGVPQATTTAVQAAAVAQAYAGPTVEQIAAEVIRHMKLPGN